MTAEVPMKIHLAFLVALLSKYLLINMAWGCLGVAAVTTSREALLQGHAGVEGAHRAPPRAYREYV